MLVRQATLDDVQAITALYASHIKTWKNSAGTAVTNADLTLFERWQHGGRWLAVETCAIWLAHLLQMSDGIPLVAEVDQQVLGYAEVFIGKEPEPYGHHIHIGSLCVHAGSQGEGLGRALIDYLVQMGNVMRCQQLTTTEASPFSEKMGFTPLVAWHEVELHAHEGHVFYKAQDLADTQPTQIQGWSMPLGRYQSARTEWEQMRWTIWNGVPQLVEAEWQRLQIDITGQPGILHLHQQDEDRSKARVRLWTKRPVTGHMVTAVLDRASRLGYKRLTTLVEASTQPLLGEGVLVGGLQWVFARRITT